MKISTLAFIATAFAAAFSNAENCQFDEKPLSYFPSTSVCLFKENALNLKNMENSVPFAENLQRDSNLWVYRSRLNPEIVVTTDGLQIELSLIYEKDSSCELENDKALFSEVLKDEFLRWQKAAVWNGSETSADSLAEHIISKMQNVFGSAYFDAYNLTSIEYNFSCDDSDSAVSILGPVFGLRFKTPTAVDSLYLCKDYTLKTSSKTFTHFAVEKMSGKTFRVQTKTCAVSFRIYDLNGVLLKRGISTKGIVEVPQFPAVLEVEGKRILVK